MARAPRAGRGASFGSGHRTYAGRGSGSSSGSTPGPVLTGIWAWFMAQQGVTKDAFNFISRIEDQSGNGRHCDNIAISGPLWVAAGIGGLATISFNDNGIENHVDNIPLGARTIMVVAQSQDAQGGALLTFRRSALDWCAYGGWFFAGTQFVWTDGAINRAAVTPVDYFTDPHVFTHVQDGSNVLTFKADNVVVPLNATGTTNETGVSAGFTLGGRALGGYLQGWLGHASEWLIYDRELTSGEQDQNMAYFAGKYSL